MIVARYKTPLRYPGGKQRLAPFVREVLARNPSLHRNYVEPYAGGSGVAIELLLGNDVERVHLNDSSLPLFAFWHSVKHEPEKLCRLISRASLSMTEWERQREVIREPEGHALLTIGFSTFYMNRCNRSGVLTAGVIGGKGQVGRWRIDARFPRNELIQRIEAIATRADDIVLYNMDAEDFIRRKVNRLGSSTLVYCDPPYFERAERLYLNAYQPSDHARVARLIQEDLLHPWMVSYDGHSEIEKLYRRRRRFLYSIQYSAISSYAGSELFIFSDGLKIPASSSVPYVNIALPTVGRRRALAR